VCVSDLQQQHLTVGAFAPTSCIHSVRAICMLHAHEEEEEGLQGVTCARIYPCVSAHQQFTCLRHVLGQDASVV
jgi:hypothetical protein